MGDFSTGQDGKIHVYDLDAGYYIITEKSVLAPYILDTTPHEVLMVEGKATNITIENKRLPDLTVAKKDSITGDPLQGAKFTVWYAPGSLSGDLREMGNYSTDENGVFVLKAVEPGWYRVTETEPPAGYAVKEPSTLDVFMEADQDKTLTFENQPLNSLVIKKVDATDGHVLQGAKFRVRYFEGVTGTGGTTIGEYETSTNGTIVITGLKAGTYIVEETHAPAGYIIDDAPKTVYLSGKEQAAVTVEFANQPDSGLTITKLDSMTKEPLAGAVFEIRNSAGAVVGQLQWPLHHRRGRNHPPARPAHRHLHGAGSPGPQRLCFVRRTPNREANPRRDPQPHLLQRPQGCTGHRQAGRGDEKAPGRGHVQSDYQLRGVRRGPGRGRVFQRPLYHRQERSNRPHRPGAGHLCGLRV